MILALLYTTITHELYLSEIIHFVFKSKVPSKTGSSETSIYWIYKSLGKRCFTENNLAEAITFLIKSSYFTIGNMLFKQDIGIPTGIASAPFWANLFLYFF